MTLLLNIVKAIIGINRFIIDPLKPIPNAKKMPFKVKLLLVSSINFGLATIILKENSNKSENRKARSAENNNISSKP